MYDAKRNKERMRNQRLFYGWVIVLLFYFTSISSPTTINGRFTVLNYTVSELSVLLQINTNTGTDDLGGATIVFRFDTSAVDFPYNPVKDVDYIFHNFNEGNYSSATVSKPIGNILWVNIDLPFNNSNNGMVVALNPEWTDLVTLNFHIIDPNKTAELSWQDTGLFWSIYDADNMTLWENGVFEDFTTSVASASELPIHYMLEQNYPNPFNPSTKIKVKLPVKTNLKLVVYNLLGEIVKVVATGEYDAGTHEFIFDAAKLASGVYLYRIDSATFIETKKMILLR